MCACEYPKSVCRVHIEFLCFWLTTIPVFEEEEDDSRAQISCVYGNQLRVDSLLTFKGCNIKSNHDCRSNDAENVIPAHQLDDECPGAQTGYESGKGDGKSGR